MRQRFAAACGWILLTSSMVGCYARPYGGGYQNGCCQPNPCCCQYGTPTGTTASYYTEPGNSEVAEADRKEPTPATAVKPKNNALR